MTEHPWDPKKSTIWDAMNQWRNEWKDPRRFSGQAFAGAKSALAFAARRGSQQVRNVKLVHLERTNLAQLEEQEAGRATIRVAKAFLRENGFRLADGWPPPNIWHDMRVWCNSDEARAKFSPNALTAPVYLCGLVYRERGVDPPTQATIGQLCQLTVAQVRKGYGIGPKRVEVLKAYLLHINQALVDGWPKTCTCGFR